ncbi:MAG: zinc ribbon domain-containing protein [Candidatus Odinarchaeota archaeon]
MNYCPYCGSNVVSSWKVCANCGHRLIDEEVSTITQEEPKIQTGKIEIEPPKVEKPYYKTQVYQTSPRRANGITALIVGIIGFSWSFALIILRILDLYSASGFMVGNLFTGMLGIIAIIFGIVGISKDDTKGMGVAGLILGIANIICIIIRFVIFFIPWPFLP